MSLGVVRRFRAISRLPGLATLGASLSSFAALLVVAVLLIDARYEHPSVPGGLGRVESIYAVLGLLAFGSAYALPADPLVRAVFFTVPLVGLVVIGQGLVGALRARLARDAWERAVASTASGHVIVCGLGRVGIRVVQWLRDLGEEVVVVQRDDDDEFLPRLRGWGVPVVLDDARRSEVLREVGVERCQAIIPCTDDDLVNLAIATEARCLKPGLKVVLRAFDEHLVSGLGRAFDINAVYSTSALSAPAFAAAALHVPVDYAMTFDDDPAKLVTITKFTVVAESRLVGVSLAELEAEFGVRVIAHRRDRFDRTPDPGIRLGVDDGFVVSGGTDALRRLGRATPPRRELERYQRGGWPIDVVADAADRPQASGRT